MVVGYLTNNIGSYITAISTMGGLLVITYINSVNTTLDPVCRRFPQTLLTLKP